MNWRTRLARWIGGKDVVQRSQLTENDFLRTAGMLSAPTRAGVHVGERTALALSALWSGITCISQDIGTLEPVLYYRDEFGANGKRKRVPLTHPVARLLEYPNPFKTRPVWWQTFIIHYLLNGAGCAAIERGEFFRPESLWLVHPRNCRIEEDSSGRPWYTVQPMTTDGRNIAAPETLLHEDILHVPGLAPDGVNGIRLIEIARETIGFGIAATTFGSALFGNGVKLSGVLQTESALSEPARENLRKSWEMMHGGPVNAGKIAVLEEGLKFTPFSQTNEQAQTKDILAWIVYEVSRLLNIPPAKLHSLEKATWGNLEQLFREYATTTLRPTLVKCEAELETKLLSPSERDAMYIEFDTNNLTRADLPTRYAAHSAAVGKFKTVNEVRAEENLPPLPGGDTLTPSKPEPIAPPETPAKPDEPPTDKPSNEGNDSSKP